MWRLSFSVLASNSTKSHAARSRNTEVDKLWREHCERAHKLNTVRYIASAAVGKNSEYHSMTRRQRPCRVEAVQLGSSNVTHGPFRELIEEGLDRGDENKDHGPDDNR
ncbi:hypothetical protein EDD17DRAFT_1900092 [Pisolithus thermaeus]|nr:hypothetical protein EDD17DRAFT_1900092 [Pisolithus thermaeus]